MTYYEKYKEMFPTVEAFAAAVEQRPLDDLCDDISTAGCNPLVAIMQLRNEAIRASLANSKATQMTSPKSPRKTPPNASIAHHQPVAAPPAPRRHVTTRQRAHA
jgi:hypothetical protein